MANQCYSIGTTNSKLRENTKTKTWKATKYSLTYKIKYVVAVATGSMSFQLWKRKPTWLSKLWRTKASPVLAKRKSNSYCKVECPKVIKARGK